MNSDQMRAAVYTLRTLNRVVMRNSPESSSPSAPCEMCSEIRGNGKLHLLYKDTFECGEVVAFIEKKHSHFII